jgi:hypothetical protein
MDCRIKSGNDDVRIIASSFGPRNCEERQRRSNPDSCASLLDCFADARNDASDSVLATRSRARALPITTQIDSPPATKEGGEAPKGACQPLPPRRQVDGTCPTHLRSGRLRAISGRARLPALRPRLWQGLPSLLSSRPCFLRLGIKRALPAPSCPSPVTAPHASAVVPKGMMPKAAPARIASPRGSTALAPHCGSHPECVPR